VPVGQPLCSGGGDRTGCHPSPSLCKSQACLGPGSHPTDGLGANTRSPSQDTREKFMDSDPDGAVQYARTQAEMESLK